MKMRNRSKIAASAVAVGALLLASCGSSSKPAATTAKPAAGATSAAPAPAGNDNVAKAKAAIVDFVKEPSGIGVSKPLSKKAPKKKIAWLECDVPTCSNYITPGFKAAAAAIGWDLLVIPVKSADPSAGFQQALDGGADYIAITGSPYATFKAGAEAAKAKGVPVLECYNTDLPSEATNLMMQCGSTAGVQKNNKLMADWVIADSNGAANVLYATINDFPVLKASSDAFKAELGATCTACSFTELNVSLDDLIGGKVPAAIASQLQANKKLNYIMYAFGDMPGGVTKSLQAAGLDKQVKQIGQDFSDFDLPEISAGTMKAWTSNPKAYSGWLMTHAAALHATGVPFADVMKEMEAPSLLPSFLVTDAKTADTIKAGNGDWNPAGMDVAFKKLWLV
jgi:ABC-type sugar transport system substrate-binding protein